MVFEQSARSSTRHEPMVVEAPGRTKARLVTMVCEPASRSKATQGIIRWLSSHLGAPRLDWFRSCASQPPMVCEPASLDNTRHEPMVVDPPGRTKVRLVPMVCDPASLSNTRHHPMVVEPPGRTKARLVPIVCEPTSDGVRASLPPQHKA